MRTLTFTSRTAARAYPLGKLIDNGPDAPKTARWARGIPCLSGSARQRRKTLRAMLRKVS
jgi:hypothetical protein